MLRATCSVRTTRSARQTYGGGSGRGGSDQGGDAREWAGVALQEGGGNGRAGGHALGARDHGGREHAGEGGGLLVGVHGDLRRWGSRLDYVCTVGLVVAAKANGAAVLNLWLWRVTRPTIFLPAQSEHTVSPNVTQPKPGAGAHARLAPLRPWRPANSLRKPLVTALPMPPRIVSWYTLVTLAVGSKARHTPTLVRVPHACAQHPRPDAQPRTAYSHCAVSR